MGTPLRLSGDGRILFATRFARMLGYGSLSVVLALYLSAVGFDGLRIGLILTLTLAGDVVISLWLTTHADRIGRRRVLAVGALLMALAGAAFAASTDFAILVLAATIGVISPSGNEVGPFLAVEQASLAQIVPDTRRTGVFAWYNLAGSVAAAIGALGAGLVAQALIGAGYDAVASYRAVLLSYAALGIVMALAFWRLSPRVEVAIPRDVSVATRLGLHRSRRVVGRLSLLFGLDAFAGGFVMQSLIAYWFHVQFGVEPAVIGAILFAANLFAAASALLAARIARRIGLINTMVFTHLPSNVLLILVPLMPSAALATAVLLARFAISQMDVPTRQSYTLAVVDPDERSAAAGVTGIARSAGAAVAPLIAAPLLVASGLAGLPFVIAGSLKIVYDLLLYRDFRGLLPPEERRQAGGPGLPAAEPQPPRSEAGAPPR